jgi:plasmid maintenance system antidote protein VapI
LYNSRLPILETQMSRKPKPVSRGEMLVEEFLRSLSTSNYRVAKEIGVPTLRIH